MGLWQTLVTHMKSHKMWHFIIPRRSRRDIVLALSVCPSVRPHFLSVRNHISVPIGQI